MNIKSRHSICQSLVLFVIVGVASFTAGPVYSQDGPDKTSDIEFCGNAGCLAYNDGKCVMTGTGCFGYIDPEWEKEGRDND